MSNPMPISNEELLTRLNERFDEMNDNYREWKGGVNERLKSSEEDAKEARKWENIKLFMVLPIVAALHTIAVKLNIFRG